jgi:hypothetical protein
MNLNLNQIVTPLRGLWDDLVESRLWPVAIVLAVALIAVPVLLLQPAKKTPPPPAAPAATGPGSPGVAFQAAVSTEGKKSSQIRKDLRSFKQKNPFTPQGVTLGGGSASASGTATPNAAAAAETNAFTGGGSSSGSGSSSSSGSTSTPTPTPTPAAPATTTKTFYYHYTVDVSFGKKGSEDDKTLNEFRSLPSSDNPVIVFMGVKNDGKTAVFLVSAKATTTGDGDCSPSDTECTFLYMKKGDTDTIETVESDNVTITDYVLTVKGINIKRTTAPQKAASSSSAHVSKADRKAYRKAGRNRLLRIENTFQALGL